MKTPKETSATVQSVLKALRLKGGKDADALIKKMRDLGLESKVSKAHADAAKKILKGQITVHLTQPSRAHTLWIQSSPSSTYIYSWLF